MTPEEAAALRAPFPASVIGKLPRVTCRDCSDKTKKCDKHQRAKCGVCTAFISTAHIHLDFVGHAAATDRLLQVDRDWTWEPMGFDADGAPAIRTSGDETSMWIRMTVAGVTRPGVGIVPAGAFERDKQLVSDAIRNAAMRFGVALDLWSKEDLHDAEANEQIPEAAPPAPKKPRRPNPALKTRVDNLAERVMALEGEASDAFAAWRADQNFEWPWTDKVCDAMELELVKLTAKTEPLPEPML